MNAIRTLIAVAVIASLAACGGGGSSSPPADTSGGSTAIAISVDGTLQTGASSSTYTPGVAADAFAALNSIRVLAGAGVLLHSASLDVSSAAHANYLNANLGMGIGHNEVAGATGYYATLASDRISKAGFSASATNETVGGTGLSRKGANYAFGMLNTVYHATAMLGQSTHVGFGTSLDGGGFPLVVTNFATRAAASGASIAFGQVPKVGALVAYPTAGQVGLPEAFSASYEVPRPPVSVLPNAIVGTPVIVGLANAEYINNNVAGSLLVTINEFTLKDAGGNLVPVAILADMLIHNGVGVSVTADSNLNSGFAVLVPLSPLVKGQTYTASFSATLKAGGAALAKTWSFTTAP